MPRRRRRRGAVAVEANAERGFLMRILLRSPKDMLAGAVAFAAVSAIIANALFLQAGGHPPPLIVPGVGVSGAGLGACQTLGAFRARSNPTNGSSNKSLPTKALRSRKLRIRWPIWSKR